MITPVTNIRRPGARLPEPQSVIMLIAPPDRSLIYFEGPEYSILPKDFVIEMREKTTHLEDRVTVMEDETRELLDNLMKWAETYKRKIERTNTRETENGLVAR
jgi:hypothetical protein